MNQDKAASENNSGAAPKKLYIKTFGCQMNEYDSGRMADLLRASESLVETDTPADADVILLNTCSIREKAQEKVFSDLGRMRALKEARPEVIIGVGGCVASQEGRAIIQRAPYVDVVFGPQTLHRLPQLISDRRTSGRAQVDVSFNEIEKFDHLPKPEAVAGSAFVSIMEGCSKFCTYCVVPYTRGSEVSRPYDDVMNEVASLVSQGVAEITLLGQNVNGYCGATEDNDTVDLAFLLQAISAMDGVKRLRYTTSHPTEMTPRLIEAHANLPKLASYLHLPVQSGSDRILAAMKRGYTALEYKSIVRKLRAARPDIVLSSDFIVGFPGETERDFEATLKLIEDVGFDSCFSFVYSPRPGTPAAEMQDDIPQEVKEERLQRLQAMVVKHSEVLSNQLLGTTQTVLVERVSRKSDQEMAGRLDNNRLVNFAGSPGMLGRFVEVKITGVYAYTLRGEAVAGA
jgi:tRNA-2-methylthio-N6-dimethylallyladenosine synthase